MAVIHEKVELPTLSSLQQCFSEATSTSDITAFIIDAKAAHKRVNVAHSERGLLFVQAPGHHLWVQCVPCRCELLGVLVVPGGSFATSFVPYLSICPAFWNDICG